MSNTYDPFNLLNSPSFPLEFKNEEEINEWNKSQASQFDKVKSGNTPISTVIYQDEIKYRFGVKPEVLLPEELTVVDTRIKKRTYTTDRTVVTSDGEGGVNVTLFRGVKIEVFLSDNGADLIREMEKQQLTVLKSKDLIQFFIETDEDLVTGRVMKSLVGNITKPGVNFSSIIKQTTHLSDKDFNRLMASLEPKYAKNFLDELLDVLLSAAPQAIMKLTIKALEFTISGVEAFRLSDKWWQADVKRQAKPAESDTKKDPLTQISDEVEKAIKFIAGQNVDLNGKYLSKWKGKGKEYVIKLGEKLKGVVDILQQFKAWLQSVTSDPSIAYKTALICGLWNGIVDMIAGLLFIAKAILSLSLKANEASQYIRNNRELLLEELDNMIDAASTINWEEALAAIGDNLKSMSGFMEVFNAAIAKVKSTKIDIKGVEWFYYIGYGATLLIPATAIAKVLGYAGKAGQAAGKFLVLIEKVLGDVFGVVFKKGASAFDNLAEVFRKIYEKLKGKGASVKKIIDEIFAKIKEWLESFVGKVGKAGILVIDNALLTVERITQYVNKKRIELYLVTYKTTNKQIRCIILEVEDFLMQTAKKLLTWDTRLNIRALADEGFELAENGGNYFLKYGQEFIDLGNLKQTAEQFNALFDKKNSTKAKKVLEEWIERIRLRREALAKHLNKFDKSFVSHFYGEGSIVGAKVKIGGKDEVWEYLMGNGGHFLDFIKQNIKIVKIKHPPKASTLDDIPIDTPYIAQIEVKYPNGWLPKIMDSSMFPRNWSYERIQQEVAWVYENTVARGYNQLPRKPNDLFNKFEFLDSNGRFKILIEVDDIGNIMNAYPFIN